MDLGDVLLPYQKKWLEDRAQVKVVEKSRRLGAGAGRCVESRDIGAGRHGCAVHFLQSGHDAGIY